MNRLASILVALFLLCAWNAYGQHLDYTYTYDAAGNRIRTTVLVTNVKGGGGTDDGTVPPPLADLQPDGETILVYPNPTTGSVRIERQGGQEIGSYRLADTNGRTLEQGTCADRGMTLDLSRLGRGTYLFEFGTERRTIHYKIIKQ